MNYKDYYLKQAGGEIDYDVYKGRSFQKGFGLEYLGRSFQKGYGLEYRSRSLQKGYGLGGMFKRFFRWIVPLVKKHAVPVLEKGASAVSDEVFSSASNLAQDLIKGKNLKTAASERFNETVEKLKTQAESTLEGRGIKRSKKPKSYIILKKAKNKKSRNLDIFDQ